MIRLKDLLFESEASEKAKSLGLTHKGYGRWADSSGKVVARTVDGKLVKVGSEEPTTKKRGKKETPQEFTVSKELKGKKWYQFFNSTDPNGDAYKKDGGDGGTGSGMGYFDLKREIEDIPDWQLLHKDDLLEKIAKILPDEKLKIWGHALSTEHYGDPQQLKAYAQYQWMNYGSVDMQGFGRSSEDLNRYSEIQKSVSKQDSEEQDFGYRAGSRQIANWRRHLSLKDQADLWIIQARWQMDSQYREDDASKQNRNRRLNEIIKDGDKGPATVELEEGKMERGMCIHKDDIKEFLSNFKIGETVVLPPSGFTQRTQFAKIFAGGVTNGPQYYGVTLRLHAKSPDEPVVGLALSGFDLYQGGRYNEELADELVQKANRGEIEGVNERTIKELEFHYPTHQVELEIIRPGFVGQKVMNIEKHIFLVPPHPSSPERYPKVVVNYVIDLVDVGEVPPDQIREAKGPIQKIKSVLSKYTSGTVHQTPDGKKPKKPVQESSLMLKDILFEITPAEKAKKLGLKSKGFGWYTDSKGNVVARSQGGKLVMLKKPKGKQKSDLTRPLVQRKKKTKKVESSSHYWPTKPRTPEQAVLESTLRTAGNAYKGGDGGTGSGLTIDDIKQIWPSLIVDSIVLNRQGSKNDILKLWGDESTATFQPFAQYGWIVQGHENIIMAGDWGYAIAHDESPIPKDKETDAKRQAAHAFQLLANERFQRSGFKSKKDAVRYAKALQKYLVSEREIFERQKKQQEIWRKSTWNYTRLIDFIVNVQRDWQSSDQHAERPDVKQRRNRKINEFVMGHGNPAKLDMKYTNPHTGETHEIDALYRGMKIDAEDIESFLENFKVGESVVMAPCGFTTNRFTANQFVEARSLGINFDRKYEEKVIGVVLKVRPKKGAKDMIGLSLTAGVGGLNDKIYDAVMDMAGLTKQEREEEIEDRFGGEDPRLAGVFKGPGELEDCINDIASYEYEHEVIRPGTVSQKVVSVTKHLFTSNDIENGACVIEIELEDEGAIEDSSLWREQLNEGVSDIAKKILYKYSGPLSAIRKFKSKEKTLKKYTNKSIHK